jgi:hypothetical protein
VVLLIAGTGAAVGRFVAVVVDDAVDDAVDNADGDDDAGGDAVRAADGSTPDRVTRMLLMTFGAPDVWAIRVAAPLCCGTVVVPSQYATPPCTRTVKPSLPIFDFASLARMVASTNLSCWALVCAFVWVDPALGAGLLESAAKAEGTRVVRNSSRARIAGVIQTSSKSAAKLSGILRCSGPGCSSMPAKRPT